MSDMELDTEGPAQQAPVRLSQAISKDGHVTVTFNFEEEPEAGTSAEPNDVEMEDAETFPEMSNIPNRKIHAQFETRFHLLLPTELAGQPFVVGDCAELGKGAPKQGLELIPGQAPGHWVSASLQVPDATPPVKYSFVVVRQGGGMIGKAKQFLGWSTDKCVKEFDKMERTVRKLPHNFAFPRGMKKAKQEFKVDYGRNEQLVKYIALLASEIDSFEGLKEGLEVAHNILQDCEWRSTSGGRKMNVNAEACLGHLADALYSGGLMNGKGERASLAVQIFLCVVASRIASEVRDPQMSRQRGYATGPVQNGQEPNVELVSACSILLSTFSGFCLFSSMREAADVLPNWAKETLRGPERIGHRSYSNHNTGVMKMVRLASSQSFEWIKQIQGLYIALGSLEPFGEVWEKRYGGWGSSGVAWGSRGVGVPVIKCSGSEDEYTEAVEVFLLTEIGESVFSGSGREGFPSHQSGQLLACIVSAAPGMKSLFHLGGNGAFVGQLQRRDTLARLFKDKFVQAARDEGNLLEARRLWSDLVLEESGLDDTENSNATENGKVAQSDSDASGVKISGYLVSAMQDMVMEAVWTAHTLSESAQDVVYSLIRDPRLFGGLVKLVQALGEPGKVRDWPRIVLDKLFISLLPAALHEGDSSLGKVCMEWMKQKVKNDAIEGCPRVCLPFAHLDRLLGSVPELTEPEEPAKGIMDLLPGKCVDSIRSLSPDTLYNHVHFLDRIINSVVYEAFYDHIRHCIEQERLFAGRLEPDWRRLVTILDALRGRRRSKDEPSNSHANPMDELINVLLDKLWGVIVDRHRSHFTVQFVVSSVSSEDALVFWEKVLVFWAEGLGGMDGGHAMVVRFLDEVSHICVQAGFGDITVEEGQVLLESQEGFVAFCDQVVACGSGPMVSDEVRQIRKSLQELDAAIRGANDEIEVIRGFLGSLCAPCGATHLVQDYRDMLQRRSEGLPTVPISQLHSPDHLHWRELEQLLTPARRIFQFRDSSTFSAAVSSIAESLTPEEKPTTVEDCADLVDRVLEKYSALWMPFFLEDDVQLRHASALLQFQKEEAIKEEFQLAKENVGDVEVVDESLLNQRIEAVSGYVRLLEDENNHKENLADMLLDIEEIFALDAEGPVHDAAVYVKLHRDNDDTNFLELTDSYTLVRNSALSYDKTQVDVLKDLSAASDLVEFVRHLGDQDIRRLTDAVEDSDSFVREDTVLCFISVKGFLLALQDSTDGEPLEQFLEALSTILPAHGTIKDPIDAKLRVCNENIFALKSLYEKVADSGQIAKEVTKRAVTMGTFEFKMNDCGLPELTEVLVMGELDSIQRQTFSLTGLQELRSRALLLVASKKHAEASGSLAGSSSEGDDEHLMQRFIAAVGFACSIFSVLTELADMGHFDYYSWSHSFDCDQLGDQLLETMEGFLEELKQKLARWLDVLSDARERFYELNFLRARQIRSLWRLLRQDLTMQSVKEQIETTLSIISPNFKVQEEVDDHLSADPRDAEDKIIQLGFWIETQFAVVEHRTRHISNSYLLLHPSCSVAPGELAVGVVEDDSMHNAIMSMYATTGQFPEPGELLICSSVTNWEDVKLLLLRALHSAGTARGGRLFCLAKIDTLKFEIQAKVVEFLQEQDLEGEGAWLLGALSESKHCYLMDHFQDSVRKMKCLSDEEMGDLISAHLQMWGPCVAIVTSEYAGLGKTELIKDMVGTKQLTNVPIGGPITRKTLVEEVQGFLKGDRLTAVHLDLSNVLDVGCLDSFLFEFIVMNYVACGETSLFFHCDENRPVFVEVANTLCEDLWHGLPFCALARRVDFQANAGGSRNTSPSFGRFMLSWRLENVKVDLDVFSPIQVVCLHLNALLSGTFAGQDLDLMDAGIRPLPADQCRGLLHHYFLQHAPHPSFALLTSFLKIFAFQLQSLSLSVYFQTFNLHYMVGNSKIRDTLLSSLLHVTRQFAIESGSAAYLSQQEQAALRDVPIADRMARRIQNLIGWDKNNHLMVLFNQGDGHSITSVYRNPRDVPRDVIDLMNSQQITVMPDFTKMQHWELCQKLLLIVGKYQMELFEGSDYILTADNFLKMVLIHLRVTSRVPVVLMGDSGCGKTSLIKFLAGLQNVALRVLNVHAGTTRDRIREFVWDVETDAMDTGMTVWAFLDEINTCNELGMINDIVCHRQIDGRQLHENVVVLVACNPYRLKDRVLPTAGYELNRGSRRAELVYSVNPLPETMMTYAWDYGELNSAAQKMYLTSMLQGSRAACLDTLMDPMVDVLMCSQECIRRVEAPWSTSLRDVRRWILLFSWFQDNLRSRPVPQSRQRTDKGVKKWLRNAQNWWIYGGAQDRGGGAELEMEIKKRSAVLALSLCYYMRLGSSDLRRQYLAEVCRIFNRHRLHISDNDFQAILHAEQCDYLDRMDLPRGIARNAALMENVFTCMVCILNRLPLFMVGRPGCSKSLSLQLIYSNLRGPDAKDPFFRKLPQVVFVSFQGSESSTSDGILKIFGKAHKYLKPDGRTMPVVLLDEIGLAEVSPHNPLKVLHSLLEPGHPKDRPDVAVVGISNWALDAAKMNRAIVLSRPDPDIDDLSKTAESISKSIVGNRLTGMLLDQITSLAEAYHDYVSRQPVENFHGLRDFYSLIKSVSEKVAKERVDLLSLQMCSLAIVRSFGGLRSFQNVRVMRKFLGKLDFTPSITIPIKQLIRESLSDSTSRHLMLITRGDFVLDVLENFILDGQDMVVMYGSGFQDDTTDDYNYRILSRIRLCLGDGRLLILKNLDRVYGALYDMLNQNYVQVGGRQYCRIALGPYSNPMCYVHPRFRCLVFMDENDIQKADPPFLNRFEKQHFDLSSLMRNIDNRVLRSLDQWVKDVSCLQEGICTERPFGPSDMFAGFNENTLTSLVLSCRDDSQFGNAAQRKLLLECKQQLMRIAFLDGVARAKWSTLAEADPVEVENLTAYYFSNRVTSLKMVLSEQMDAKPNSSEEATSREPVKKRDLSHPQARRFLVMSEVPLQSATLASLGQDFNLKLYKLGTFKSEKSMMDVVEGFYKDLGESSANLLIFETTTREDGRAVQLLRSLVEECRRQFAIRMKTSQDGGDEAEFDVFRHVCILVRVQRGLDGMTPQVDDGSRGDWHFNFLSGWEQFTLSDPKGEGRDVERLLNDSLIEILASGTVPLSQVLDKVLLRSFLCLKYDPRVDSVKHTRHVVSWIMEDPDIVNVLCTRIRSILSSDLVMNPLWQREIVCSRVKLVNAGGVLRAAERFIEEMVGNILAKFVCVLERHSSMFSYFGMDSEMRDLWRELFMESEIVSVDGIPDPAGLECYRVGPQVQFKLPFVGKVYCLIDDQTDLLNQLTNEQNEDIHQGNIDMVAEIGNRLMDRLATTCQQPLLEAFLSKPDAYVDDFCARTAVDLFPESLDAFQVVFKKYLSRFQALLGGPAEEGGSSATMEVVHSGILAHIVWAAQKNEILSLVDLIARYPDLAKQLGKVNSGDVSMVEAVLKATIESLKERLDSASNGDEVDAWVGESGRVLASLRNLKPQMGADELHMVNSLQVVWEFVRAINQAGVDADDLKMSLMEVTRQRLGKSLSPNGTVNLTQSSRGIRLVIDTANECRVTCRRFEEGGMDLQGCIDKMGQVSSAFLSECLREAGEIDAVLSTVCGAVFQDPALPQMLPVMMSLLDVLDGVDGLLGEHLLNSALGNCSSSLLSTVTQCLDKVEFDSEAATIFADALQIRVFDSIGKSILRGEAALDVGQRRINGLLGAIGNTASSTTSQITISVAFLRSFMDLLPGVFGGWLAGFDGSGESERLRALRMGLEKEQRGFRTILQTVSTCLGASASPTHYSLMLYLLKVYRRNGSSIRELQQLCKDLSHSKVFSCLDKVQWAALEGNEKISFNPLQYLPFYSEAEGLVTRGLRRSEDGRDELAQYIRNASQEQRQGLLASVVTHLYLPRSWRELDSAEIDLVNWLVIQSNTENSAFRSWPRRDCALLEMFAANDFTGPDFRLHTETGAGEVNMVLLEVHLVLGAMCENSLLGLMFNMDNRVNGLFLPAMPIDEERMILNSFANATGGPVTRYECSCGYKFVIGDCGQPKGMGNCPECKRELGAGCQRNQQRIDGGPQHTQAAQEIPGFVLVEHAEGSNHETVRNFSPIGYRMARLWMQSVLLFASKHPNVIPGQLESVLKNVGDARSVLDRCRAQDWGVLRELLPVSGERVVILLHRLLSSFITGGLRRRNSFQSPADRAEWEGWFMQEVLAPVLQNPQETINRYLGELQEQDDNSVEAIIDEMEESPDRATLPRMLRLRLPLGLGLFRANVAEGRQREENPLLVHVVDAFDDAWKSDLCYVKHLGPLVEWACAVQSRLAHRIRRSKAANMSVKKFLRLHPDLRPVFEKMEAAWNSARHVSDRFECTELEDGIPPMSTDAILTMCCYEKEDAGIYLAALIHHLAGVQNQFLSNAREILSRLTFKSVNPVFAPKPIKDVSESDLIDLDNDWLEMTVLRSGFASWEPNYGAGLRVNIQMDQIEEACAEKMFDRKRVLDIDILEKIVYQMEAFHTSATMLSDVSSRIPQEALSTDGLRSIQTTVRQNADVSLLDLLGGLEVVICVLKRVGGKVDSSLHEFVAAWIDDKFVQEMFAKSTGSTLGDVQLKHVLSLYECVEGLLGQVSLSTISDQYKQPLGKKLEERMRSVVDFGSWTGAKKTQKTRVPGGEGRIDSVVFSTILRRFIFRFLCGDGEAAKPNCPLNIYLCDTRCIVWPSNALSCVDVGNRDKEDVIDDLLPDGLLVAHCFSILELLDGEKAPSGSHG